MSLVLQEQVEQGWKTLPAELSKRIRGWSFNLVMLALQDLKNDGIVAYYEVLTDSDPLVVCCVPFRGHASRLAVSLSDQSVCYAD